MHVHVAVAAAEVLAGDHVAEQLAPHGRPGKPVDGDFVFVLELHHRALRDHVRLARRPHRLQLMRRVRVAPVEAAARRVRPPPAPRRWACARRRRRRRLPVDRQVAGFGQQLLQTQRRAGRAPSIRSGWSCAGRRRCRPSPRPRAGAGRAASSRAPLRGPSGRTRACGCWSSCQLPACWARCAGRLEPSTSLTGLENVRWMCVAGEIRACPRRAG